MGEAEKKNVKRLIDARDQDDDVEEDIVGKEFELRETEVLKTENLSLKQELLIRQKEDLEIEMGQLQNAIRVRLGLPENAILGFDLKNRKITIKEVSNERSRK